MSNDYNQKANIGSIINTENPIVSGVIDTSTSKYSLLPRTFIAPLDILFEVSTICNFTCLHCYNTSHPQGITFDEATFNRLIDEIIELQPIRCCFSGGEPFLLPDRILQAALRMRKSGILTSSITNGWAISRDLVPAIADSFVGIQVSIDSATEEIHDTIRNEKGAFKRAVHALEILSGKIAHLHAACVATSMNYQQLPALASLLVSIGISHLSIQPIALQGRAKYRPDLGLNSTMLHVLVELVAEARVNLADKLKLDILDPFESAKRHLVPRRIPNQQMYIAANGDVFCIPFIPVKIGNCKEKSLRQNWNDGLDTYFQQQTVKKFLDSL